MEYSWNIDEHRRLDPRILRVQGRSDFVGGIDNEALDFSQLEAFINSEDPGNPDSHSANGSYFADTLQADTSVSVVANQNQQNSGNNDTITTNVNGPNALVDETDERGIKIPNLIIIDKRHGSHHLPESPPDSGSEHPYSPSDNSEHHNLTPNDTNNVIYTTLNRVTNSFKHETNQNDLINPLLATEHLIVGEANGLHPASHQLLIGVPQLVQNDPSQTHHIIQNQKTSRHINTNSIVEMCQPNRTSPLSTTEYSRNLSTLTGDLDGNSAPTIMMQSPPPLVPTRGASTIASGLLQPSIGVIDSTDIQSVYSNLQNISPNHNVPSKKRKISYNHAEVSPLVKSEPELSPESKQTLDCTSEDFSTIDMNVTLEAGANGLFPDNAYQCIRFNPFKPVQWHVLIDQNLKDIPVPYYRVDADKGFNFSNADDAFVCQKKNHFQITCHIQIQGDAQFVKTMEGLQKINSFHIHFYGVKYEAPNQTIKIEQSQSDRSKKPFHPVLVDLQKEKITKVTVGRLHFSETTSNNMRKKGKPNPEQRYFQLVVGLHAHTAHAHYPITSLASERIIVRASNPGQFESDVEPCWQKGQTQDSIYHTGKVGINIDRPDEALVIHGNLKITGNIVHPSDLRAKQNIIECNTAEQLKNVQKLRVVKYNYQPEFASHSGLMQPNLMDTGVIAQEVAEILPEAVTSAGNIILPSGETIDNFLVVNKERIFMENIGAVKELCKVTDNLETRIDQLEKINRRLNKLKRGDSLKSNTSTLTSSKSNTYKTMKKSSDYHKNHKCDSIENELCSNKMIHVTIIVLVLIMAFCLAAITTLYFIESQNYYLRRTYDTNVSNKHSQKTSTTQKTTTIYPQKPRLEDMFMTSGPNPIFQDEDRFVSGSSINLKPQKSFVKPRPWYRESSLKNIDNAVSKDLETDGLVKNNKMKSSHHDSNTESSSSQLFTQHANVINTPTPIGAPAYCGASMSATFESRSNCQTYCCDSDLNTRENNQETLNEESHSYMKNSGDDKKTSFDNGERNFENGDINEFNSSKYANDKIKLTKQLYLNNIQSNKEVRLRRGADLDWNEQENIYNDNNFYNSDLFFTIVIQGRTFNATLNKDYCLDCTSNVNVTYIVPISKYLQDDIFYLNFRNTKTNIRELEFCFNNVKQNECYYGQDDIWLQQQQQRAQVKNSHRKEMLTHIDEKNGFRRYGMRFEVDMTGYVSKSLTYRGSLVQNNQNVCELPSTKIGIDYLQYNFNFYRDCE